MQDSLNITNAVGSHLSNIPRQKPSHSHLNLYSHVQHTRDYECVGLMKPSGGEGVCLCTRKPVTRRSTVSAPLHPATTSVISNRSNTLETWLYTDCSLLIRRHRQYTNLSCTSALTARHSQLCVAHHHQCGCTTTKILCSFSLLVFSG